MPKHRLESRNGQKGGDPAKLPAALVTIAARKDLCGSLPTPAPVDAVEGKANDPLAQADAHHEPSINLDHTEN
jgi:hypothetical protein